MDSTPSAKRPAAGRVAGAVVVAIWVAAALLCLLWVYKALAEARLTP